MFTQLDMKSRVFGRFQGASLRSIRRSADEVHGDGAEWVHDAEDQKIEEKLVGLGLTR
jgi:hypothetical protein